MKEKQISNRQMILIISIIGMAMTMFMLPSLIIKSGGRDSYLGMIFYIIVEAVVLMCVLITIKLAGDKNIFEVMSLSLGKVIPKIIVSIVIIFILFKTTLIFMEYKVFYSENLFDSFNWSILSVPLLALIGFTSINKLQKIGRVAEIFAPFIYVSLLILVGIIVFQIDYTEILPVLEHGVGDLVRTIRDFPMWFGDFFILLLFVGNVKCSKKFITMGIVSGFVSSVVVLFFTVALCASYGNMPEIVDYGQIVSMMTQFATGTQFFGRFDLVIYGMWAVSVLISLMVYFYALVRCIQHVISVKNKSIITVGVIVVIYIMTTRIFSNHNVFYNFLIEYFGLFAVMVQYVLPIFVLILAIAKRRKLSEKVEG